METDYPFYGKVQFEEVKEMVRSVLAREGYKIVDEFDLNNEGKEGERYYRFVFDCNPLFIRELEQNGLVPNIPYLNLIIHSPKDMRSEIHVSDPNLTMTSLQKKRFKPIIPLIEESLTQALDDIMVH